MGIQTKILLIFTLLIVQAPRAFAQGDFAPFENPKKLNQATKGAAPTAPARKKDTGQDATVKQDGAPIYEVANFDSPVMEYLERGKKINISRKLYPGIGGLGAFYKVRIARGVYGYITDVDVELARGAARGRGTQRPPAPEEDQGGGDAIFGDPSIFSPELEGDEPLEGAPGTIGEERWVGLVYGSYNYSELIANNRKTAQTPMFGGKISGSTGFMGGAPMDLTFLFTSTAPGFYDQISNSTSGFMLIGNAIMMIPITKFRFGSLYYGAGLMGKYVKWDVKLKGQEGKPAIDSQDFTLGLAGELGLFWQMTRKLGLRLESKYFYEKESYFGFDAALQFRY